MRKIYIAFFLLLLCSVLLTSCSFGSNSSSSKVCTKGEVKAEISWGKGIVLTFNHCAVRDILATSQAATALSPLMIAACPNPACKFAAAGLTAFVISQSFELKDIDDQCGNQGAILVVGSFNDKTLWAIKPICGTTPGHLNLVDNNHNRESKLACSDIYLSFTVQNTGQQVVKWHLVIYYGNTHLQSPNLRVFTVEDGGHIRTGGKPGTYDEEGLISGQKTTIAVTGSIDPKMMKQYKYVTLTYVAIGGDHHNPPSVIIKCS